MKILNISLPRAGIEPTTCRVYSHTLVPLRHHWHHVMLHVIVKMEYESNKIYLPIFFQNRGTVLILGGIMLNVWAAALLFQPVEEHMVKKYKEVQEDDDGNQVRCFLLSVSHC